MKILNWEKFVASFKYPDCTFQILTTWAVPVFAGVVGNMPLFAVITLQHMAAQQYRLTGFEGMHDLKLVEGYMSRIFYSISRTIKSEDFVYSQQYSFLKGVLHKRNVHGADYSFLVIHPDVQIDAGCFD